MTRREGESRIRWLKRVAETVVFRGYPPFRKGDRVTIIDDAARTVLGDSTGTVEEVVAPFGDWKFRVVADDPEKPESTFSPNEGTLLTANQIAAISAKESDQ